MSRKHGLEGFSVPLNSNLCLSKVVELAQWLAMLEEKIMLLKWEIEHLREAVREIGADLGLE